MEVKFGKLDFESSSPYYMQIADIIGSKIAKKEINIGEKLPPEENLRKVFNVSLDTMREAMAKLIEEGYIKRRPSIGTVVINSEPRKGIDLKNRNEIAVINCGFERDKNAEFARSRLIIEGIEQKAKEKKVYLLSHSIKDDEDRAFLLEKQKDLAGMIIIDAISRENYRLIKSMKIPFVLVGDLRDTKLTEPEVDIVVNDDFQGTYLAAKHLIASGHRRIVYFARWFSKYSWHMKKLRGYEEALKEAGIVCDKNLEIELGEEESLDKTPVLLKKAMNGTEPFTAMICDDVEFYAEAKKSLEEMGKNIPGDISMVVISLVADATSVVCDLKEMGSIAVEKLIERQTNTGWNPSRITVPCRLVENGTTLKIVGK